MTTHTHTQINSHTYTYLTHTKSHSLSLSIYISPALSASLTQGEVLGEELVGEPVDPDQPVQLHNTRDVPGLEPTNIER